MPQVGAGGATSPRPSRTHRIRILIRIRIRVHIRIQVGQERYHAVTSSHYRRADGAVVVFDESAASLQVSRH